jgi:predicted nuclease with RNAse H fold
MTEALIVAGIDVGGSKKGFHAVALRDGVYLNQFVSCAAVEVAAWCRRIGARCIGVDAPCRWSRNGHARPAERALMAAGISCFSTPLQQTAETHQTNYYGWMRNGAALFAQLELTHALFDGNPGLPELPICVETFPQAVACGLAGKTVPAKQKATRRRDVLTRAGMAIGALTNIDKVDAALCALAAHRLAIGDFKSYGDATTGCIVVPNAALASCRIAECAAPDAAMKVH